MTRQESFYFSRTVVGALAVLIGILALWLMAGEILRPRLIYFPSDRNEAEALDAARASAAEAAQAGMIRGDLWTEATITNAAPSLFGVAASSSEPTLQAGFENMRTIANRAARLSPHDPRVWLVLAGLNSRFGGNNSRTAEAFKLSYYTGPNEFSLAPLRLLLAVQSASISDEEIQSLVAQEIRHVVMQRPELKPAIASAYKSARPKGREVVEAVLEEADPGFLATIRAR